MEAEGQLVELRQEEERQSKEEDLQQQKEAESASKKEGEERGGGIRKINLEEVSSEEHGKEGNLVRGGGGGVSVQSHEADIEIKNVDSDDLTESQKPHLSPPQIQQEAAPATLEEGSLHPRGLGGRYEGRLRSRERITEKKPNLDHINPQLLQFSEDDSESAREGVEKRRAWERKKCRTDPQSSSSEEVAQVTSLPESNGGNPAINSLECSRRANFSQHDLTKWLEKRRRSSRGDNNFQYFDFCAGREAPSFSSAQPPLQNEISSSKENHWVGRSSLHEERDSAGKRTTGSSLSSSSSVGRIGSSCKQKSRSVTRSSSSRRMVTHLEPFERELGGRHEGGSAATQRKPPVRKRKAAIPADQLFLFPEATSNNNHSNGLDALSNRRQRSDATERGLREEVAEHSRPGVVFDAFEQTPPPSANPQFPDYMLEAFVHGKIARGPPQFDECFDAITSGKICQPGTPVHGSPSYSGRATSPPLTVDNLPYIGHWYPQLEGGVQNTDVFSIPSEPCTSDSLGTAQFEGRLSSDEDYRPPAGRWARHLDIHNVGTPIPTSSYPSKSRRSLSFRTDGAPQRAWSISTPPSSNGRAPPAPPNNAMSGAEFYANPIQDNNEAASFGANWVFPMNDDDAGMAVVEDGDEDYDPDDDGNLLDEEDHEGKQKRLFDLNEPSEQQKQPRKTSRARKKHRPKVFREGCPDRRRKPKNAEEVISKTKKASSGRKKVDGKTGTRKKRATLDLKSAQGDLQRNQGDYVMPGAANCGLGMERYAQCQDARWISDAGRWMPSQEGQAMGTEEEDLLQNRGNFDFPQNQGPHTPPSELMMVPSPSRKRSGEDDHPALDDSPMRGVSRELFKTSRRKRSTAHSKHRLGWVVEKYQEPLNQAAAAHHPSAVSAAKTVGVRSRMRTDASHSQEIVPHESQGPSMGNALCDPAAAKLVGSAVLSITLNPSNSEEGVSGETSIISTEIGMRNGSTTIPEENVLPNVRLRVAARAKARYPNVSVRVKRSYTRRAPLMPRRPKQTDTNRMLELVVSGMANTHLAETDSGLQIVPYANQITAMVPFMPIRRKKPRARVMLDGEDKRVWRLLMTQGTTFEDDTTEKEAPRQWDEERATMKARAEKFINRMHLVQGDRRFSVWKGSVVDSVVGAFLTQNVSDHLSSSAFMCLASRFPVARKKKAATETSQEATVTEVQVEEAYEITLKASEIPNCGDGAEAAQESRMTAYHVEEAFDVSEKSSATGDGSSICCNQQAHDTLSTELTNQAYDTLSTELTNQAHDTLSTELTDLTHDTLSTELTDRAHDTLSTELTNQAHDTLSTESTDQAHETLSTESTDQAHDTLSTELTDQAHDTLSTESTDQVHDTLSTELTDQAHDTLSTELTDQAHDTLSSELTVQAHDTLSSELTDQAHDTFSSELTDQAHDTLSTESTDQAHDTLSTEFADHSKRGREPTTETLGSTFPEQMGTEWQYRGQYYSEETLTDTREQNSSCSSKTSQSQCNSCVHNATSQAEDSLEVMDSEEKKSWGALVDDTSLHSGPEVVLLALSDHGHLNSIDSIPIEDVGKTVETKMAVPAPHSWIGTELLRGSLFVDLSLTADDRMTDMDSSFDAIRIQVANNSRTHETGGNAVPQKENGSSALPDLDVTFAAAEEFVASSSSVVSSSDSLEAYKLSQSSVITGLDINCSLVEEMGADTAGMIIPVDNFDTNKAYEQQLVISSEAEPSEQLDLSYMGSSHLRTVKTYIRKMGPKSRNGKTNSDQDDQEDVRGRKKRPFLSLTGIARARLEQSNISSKVAFDWEAMRLKYTRPMGENQHESLHAGCKSFGSSDVENGVDWDAVRSAKLEDIADVIKERGMNNVLAGRIKAFLERVHKEHGSVDLEWLRTVSVEEAKSFLLSIRGLGLKSVECIRLLTLHHLAFPVDTNVGRICVRLGWVPLEPLPEELQLHLLEMYPVQETIQKYLWPRLCTLDQRTLYELHYQMITFGKVFCTKSRPNCNACPMRDDCRHFASALASARLALPAAAHEDTHPTYAEPLALPAAATQFMHKVKLALPPSEQDEVATGEELRVAASQSDSFLLSQKPCEPIVEEPRTPEPEIGDIEDCYMFGGVSSQPSGSEKGSSSEMEIVLPPAEVSIPDIASRALVLLPPDSASIPVPKLKNAGRLRTVHYVYELPDSHPLVQEMDPREDDDPCFYLLAIWSPGESPQALPALDDMYTNGTCDGFNSGDEETVKGTVLVPCRTAMRGIFPLNGTYFQVNEVFADHASSLQPIEVPRTLLWNLRRRFVYFGTSVTSIFKGLSTEEIQACFWRGYVCVRGFDSVSRCPRPLAARLHFPASKMARKQKGEKPSPSNAED